MKYLYYPGCSQKSSAIPYDKSLLAICSRLGIELVELDNWNCCGATIAISINKLLSSFLAARNLALAKPSNLPLVTPCPSCYISLKRIIQIIKENDLLSGKINELLATENLTINTDIDIYNTLEFLVNVVGLDNIREKVINHLTGIKIAPYYGCQIVSPYVSGDNNSDPQNLEKLINALGAQPVEFHFRTQCCGGSLMFTRKEQANKLSRMILQSIQNKEADFIVTPCGLCQLNLTMVQEMSRSYLAKRTSIPVLNIAQLIGLAFDLHPKKIFVNKKQILSKREMESEAIQKQKF